MERSKQEVLNRPEYSGKLIDRLLADVDRRLEGARKLQPAKAQTTEDADGKA